MFLLDFSLHRGHVWSITGCCRVPLLQIGVDESRTFLHVTFKSAIRSSFKHFYIVKSIVIYLNNDSKEQGCDPGEWQPLSGSSCSIFRQIYHKPLCFLCLREVVFHHLEMISPSVLPESFIFPSALCNKAISLYAIKQSNRFPTNILLLTTNATAHGQILPVISVTCYNKMCV